MRDCGDADAEIGVICVVKRYAARENKKRNEAKIFVNIAIP
jgi:hypothetical protein